MTQHAVNPARRRILQSTVLAASASLLPFGMGMAQPPARARWRRPAASSKMGVRMLQSYARAVRAMLALPPEDPRNWYRQAIIHTLDCPHGNWWFLPFSQTYAKLSIVNFSLDSCFAGAGFVLRFTHRTSAFPSTG